MRKPGKRMASVIASIAAVCVMTGGIGYQAAVSGAQTDSTENSVKAQNTDQQESTDGSFSEEGTTQIGTVSQMPEFTVNAVTMTVEEVYASSGDTVSKGDALFKLTDESMEAAKSDYEDAISDAENTLKNSRGESCKRKTFCGEHKAGRRSDSSDRSGQLSGTGRCARCRSGRKKRSL